MYGAVAVDDVVVADAVETALAVPLVDGAHRVVAPLDGGGAVDDDEIDFAHDELELKNNAKVVNCNKMEKDTNRPCKARNRKNRDGS